MTLTEREVLASVFLFSLLILIVLIAAESGVSEWEVWITLFGGGIHTLM
jgi:hypothetical protein